MSLEAGDPAPDFTLQDDEEKSVTLSGLRGKPVVLYFYPKDNTPGCTTEACDFRDNMARAKGAGAVVYGKVVRAWRNVRVKGHVDAVLEALGGME